MNETATEFLHKLFRVTRDTNPEFVTALMYREAEVGLPVRPWWPPLVEVWLYPDDPPPPFDRDPGRRHWQEARELLDALHADYQRAKSH